jgi:hypothetical protein
MREDRTSSAHRARWRVVVICVAACSIPAAVGVVWLYVFLARDYETSVVKPTDAVIDFLQDLRSGEYKAAYSRTSTRFQQKQSFGTFRTAFSGSSPWETHSSVHVQSTVTFQSGNVRFSTLYVILHGRREVGCTVELVEEAGEWRIQSFRIP